MDKTILKNFAKEARRNLAEKIEVKINSYFVNEDFKEEHKGDTVVLSNENHTLTIAKSKYEKRKILIQRISEKGLEQVIEEASYTWFNRFIAIRYMELNDMLPLTKKNESLNIRVLSSRDNTLDPEIMVYSNITNSELDLKINKEEYSKLKSDNEKFEYVLLKVCEKLGKVIPQVFDGVTDYIDILSPHNLLTEESVVGKLIKINEDNFKDVEVIGWLYQYYNQEEKDRVISAKKAYKKNEVPYATQLFTPDWIVKYMVENSLGKYWLENKESNALYPSDNLYPSENLYPNSSIKSNWKYYIEDAKQEPEVQAELDNLKNPNLNPKDITFIDPCSGSGHILVYAYEVLYQIYESYGYNKKDISKLILENNIYGLDIDDRAGQLSILSLLLKARSYDKELFKKEIKLNIYSIQESNNINETALYDIRSKETNEIIDYVLEVFKDAKEYGSILKVEKKDYQLVINKIKNVDTLFKTELEDYFLPLLEQAILLSSKYDVVVTNPPYMNKLSTKLKDYVNSEYKKCSADLFSVFMVKNLEITKLNGYSSYMTPNVWMFIKTYEETRSFISNKSISSFVQLAKGSFFKEATVDVCAFSIKNIDVNYRGVYLRLEKYKGDMLMQEKSFVRIKINKEEESYFEKSKNFISKLPSKILGYWLNDNYIKIFEESKKLIDYAVPRQGLATGENEKFLRLWSEINIKNSKLRSKSRQESIESNLKWFPYNKGGEFRKWYGNNDFVVNWENDGYQIRNYKSSDGKLLSRPQNTSYYFSESITWSKISSGSIAFRYKPFGHIFDVAGTSIFGSSINLKYLLALNNSKVIKQILSATSPTLNYEVGQISQIPVKKPNSTDLIQKTVEENINISKTDWDSFEESWDFEKHPLLTYKENNSIKYSFKSWESFTEKQFNQLKSNEEELNRIFIDIYGLQDELTPEVDDKDITIRKADEKREIKSLISYAVGCMLGRYSLDQDGLVYAGGDFDHSKYKSFKADKDNIIPINDNNYFNDDIVVKFKEFIKVAFGEEKLYENLEYISEVIGKRNNETNEDTIRRYFINDFFADHVKIYKKRPIYWLLDSGKDNGFKCLIYMHRYDSNIAAKIRLDYLHGVQNVYERELEEVKYKLTGDLSPVDRKEALKIQSDLTKKLTEIKDFDEKLDHIANQKIDIDLDDGVKVNYAKFESVLAKIK